MSFERRRKISAKHLSLILWGNMLLLLILTGCDGGSTVSVKLTPTPIPFVPLQLAIPAKALNAPVTGKVPDDQLLHVGITLKLDQQALDTLSKKGVAKPGDTTTTNEIAKKLGISDADYQHIKQYFGANDGTLQLSQTRTSMKLDIKAGKLAEVLQTHFVVHTLDKRQFYTPDPHQMPKVPQFVADRILAVTGLDNYSLPPTHQLAALPRQSSTKAQDTPNCNTHDAMSWQQVAAAYSYDQMWQKGWRGEGMTVNLVEWWGVDQNDLQVYFACSGFKGKFDITTVGQAPKSNDRLESTLDIEMIAGLAPAAHIKDYQSDTSTLTGYDDPWNNLAEILQRIIDDNAAQTDLGSSVSISLGGSEEIVTGEVAKTISQRFQLLTEVEHMTVYVASGDCGAYSDGIFGSLSVSYPASDPWAVGVGGTTVITGLANNNVKEIAWTGVPTKSSCDNDWGTGGGLSTLFKKPTWQQGPNVDNRYSNGSRQVPDIAAIASYIPIFEGGKWKPVDGTSAATPIWAAGMALVNQGLLATKGFYAYGPDTFYFVQQYGGNLKPYYDQVEGNNQYYYAGPGWDYTTGLGSPNLPAIYQTIFDNAQA